MKTNLFKIFLFSSVLLLFNSCKSETKSESESSNDKKEFEANWESLSKIDREPEWFKDAKMGIYFHWGIYSVPAYETEWYPRWMYVPGRDNDNWGGDVYEHQIETYGPLDAFNYHDFIPMFKAENFDAAEWVGLFEKSGARFAGLVAQHHDGFAMWDSSLNPWNSRDMGPRKDILGELFEEIKSRDMRTVATFHHARLLQRYAQDTAKWAKNTPDPGEDSHFPYHPDFITSTTDPKLRKLYGNIPADEFHEYWLNQVNEVVDKYNPDMIYFDSWLDKIPEKYRQEMVAYHFNKANSQGQQPIVTYKQEDLPQNVGVLDIEQGGKTGLSDDYWLTDVTISYGGWSYTKGQKYKDPALVIRNMIDVWSKKGIVLLNVSPRADGVIPATQRKVLASIGNWMNKHKDAVYGTRAYSTFGYGDAKFEEGQFGGQSATMQYSNKDIRFTQSKDEKHLYVFSLGLPDANAELEIKNVQASEVKNISVLGSGVDLDWSESDDGVIITTPDESAMNDLATVFQIDF